MSERREELVARYVERREAGEALDPGTYAAEYPEESPELLAALRALVDAEALFPSGVDLVERPTRIGPWKVVGELGRGGAGRVFRVERADRPGQAFALKLIGVASVGDPRAIERFRREGAILEALEHPDVVRVHEVATEGALPHIVMDLVEGPSLGSRLADARREQRTSRADTPTTELLELGGGGDAVRSAAALVARLARAVAFAHERGLLHRDLKPGNVLLGPDDSPILVDFGLAAAEGSATLTVSGDLLGTPNYMAPEQALGQRADPRTDVWGLGAILYELLTLHPPHTGSDPLEVLESIRRRPVPPVRRRNPRVPPALARIVRRALAWRRARRTPSATALAEDLEAFLAGASAAARSPGPIERAEDLLRFRPWAAVLAAVAGLLVLLVLALRPGEAARAAERTRLLREVDLTWVDGNLVDLEGLLPRLEAAGEEAWVQGLSAYLEDEPVPITGATAVDAFFEGVALRRERKRAAARDAFERASRAAPDWPLPIAIAGFMAEDASDEERALAKLEVASRLLPDSTNVARKLARILRKAGRPEEAVAELERVLERRPASWQCWSSLAAALGKADRTSEALEAIERAFEIAPEPTSSMLNRKAAILDGLARPDEAKEIFRELLENEPSDVVVLMNLALTLDGECRLAEARRAYHDVLAADADHFQARVSLANLAAGSNREECAACRRAFDAAPHLLNPEEAARQIVRALEIDTGRTPWFPDYAVEVAQRADCEDEVQAALEALIDEDEEVDERVVRIERALRKLREH